MSARTVITFGTFDVVHVGNIRVRQRAVALCDRSVTRTASVASPRVADGVFAAESLEEKHRHVLPRTPSVWPTGIVERIPSPAS